jgi:hypothetical protein
MELPITEIRELPEDHIHGRIRNEICTEKPWSRQTNLPRKERDSSVFTYVRLYMPETIYNGKNEAEAGRV